MHQWKPGRQFCQVDKVLERLAGGNLKFDIKKSDSTVKRVNYLKFVITARDGISVDPEKKITIESWELPRTQAGMRSFLGFADFY